jgi:alpha-maltose-1-phosphate synthase
MEFALTYARNVYDFDGKVMGRQSAGNGFLRAALAARPTRIWCYAEHLDDAQKFGRTVQSLAALPPEIQFIPWSAPARLSSAGILYRPDPGICEDAWHRRHHATARSYSLCGVTHTLASHGVLTGLSQVVTAPLFPWDALICTSTVAKNAIRQLLDAEADHLRSRTGAVRFVEPQLPIIPLGVHCADFEFSEELRLESRSKLNIAPDDVAVLFAGRLAFHAKAHPMPTFLGLEGAAKRSIRKVHLILFGQFPNAAIAAAFRREAQLFAPSVSLIVVDGAVPTNRDVAWSAADIFTSFSDNIQETFGLTPVEAMASGIPVVVSDWNGYKDTVRDGIDGYRVLTWAAPPGFGQDLADRYDMRLDNYDIHIGSASQFVAVDVGASIEAFVQLIESKDLRTQMGSAGRRRARQMFDWKVVFQQYENLWLDLSALRQSSPLLENEDNRSRRPDRPDPFTLFQSFPTKIPMRGTYVFRRGASSVGKIADLLALSTVKYASAVLPNQATLQRLLDQMPENGFVCIEDLLKTVPDLLPGKVVRAVLWMAKMGIIGLRESSIN